MSVTTSDRRPPIVIPTRTFKLLLAAASLLGLATQASAKSGDVALTFDDLPGLTILNDQPYVDYLNRALVRQLRRHHLPATGFVNEGKLDELVRIRQIANLKVWTDAGLDLGNHGYSHESINDLGPAAFIADIAKGETVTRQLLADRHQQLRYFRHPYLETGRSAAIRGTVDRWLARHGYRTAPVTIDADDWEFAEPYDDAIARRDKVRQRRIRSEYLAYTAKRIAWSQQSARLLFGRDIAHIMLLHDSRLNADSLGDLARLLRRAGLRAVTLDQALTDPVYARPGTYAGADGIGWLDRWALARHVDLPEKGDEDPPADIQADYKRVDNDLR